MNLKSTLGIMLLCFVCLYPLTGCDDGSSDDKDTSLKWDKIDWRTADNGAYADFTYNDLAPSCSNAPGTTSSEFYFFARGGDTENLVIYFEGGGACWHTNNCITATAYTKQITQTADNLNASTAGTGTVNGIIDYTEESNPFKDWDMVYIPYCTGDLAWGATDTEYTGDTIRHRGHVNFQLVLAWLKNHYDSPENILVCGTSAGAFSAPFNFPYIRESFPDSQFYLIGDSGIGVVSDDFNSNSSYGVVSWDIQVPTTDSLPDGSTFDDFDGVEISSITMDDIYIALANHYDDVVVAEYTTRYDTTMTMFYNMMLNIDTPANWLDYDGVWCDWVDQMETILDTETMGITAGNFHYYIAPGSAHTILMKEGLYTTTSDGTALIDWITAMVEGTDGFENVECTDCDKPSTCPDCE
ncbi:MAG TPA: pectin acetylesterase-family hydrolase [Spirochaetota bacterium]|nr:pectin acetylesterase-family hydrolase [Spirochaetota bacterium]HRZ26339.1 pectin acetylesterase-family hydrolase [Spirochaetota bacterium]HSA14788.1 pectin acetylesterase-family hydrolase [Spirochaetota bacterium]